MTAGALLGGIVFSESVIHSRWYAVLSTFVGINTVLYLTLAVLKIFPKAYLSDFIAQRNQRSETRSIYPKGYKPEVSDEPRSASDTRLGAAEVIARGHIRLGRSMGLDSDRTSALAIEG